MSVLLMVVHYQYLGMQNPPIVSQYIECLIDIAKLVEHLLINNICFGGPTSIIIKDQK